MNARWKFRKVDHSLNRSTVRSGRLPLEVFGSDGDALTVAKQLARDANSIRRIEVESVGPIEGLPAQPSPAVCRIEQRQDGKGWMIFEDRLQHYCWQPTIIDAVSYASFRTRGTLAEFRIHRCTGELIQVVLVDQRNWVDGLKFPKAASPK